MARLITQTEPDSFNSPTLTGLVAGTPEIVIAEAKIDAPLLRFDREADY
jgi:hypothetical protein